MWKVLVVLVIVVAGLSLAQTPQVQLVYWSRTGSGALGEGLTQLVAEFEAQNPDIDIELVIRRNRDHFAAVDAAAAAEAAGAGRQLPTIWEAFPNNTATYIELGLIRPIDDLLDLTPLDLADFYPVIFANDNFNGRLYSVPVSKSVQVMYYNADLFREAGLALPTTLDALVSTARALTLSDGDGDGLPDRYGYGLRPTTSDFAYYLFTLGGQFMDDQGNFVFNNATGVRALEFMINLVQEGIAFNGGTNFLDGPFGQQRFAFMVDTSASRSFVEQSATFALGITTLPGAREGDIGIADIQGTSLVLNKNATEAEAEAAARFMRFWVSPEAAGFWTQISNYLPARVSTQLDGDFANYLRENSNNTAIFRQVDHAAFEPQISTWSTIRFDCIERAIQRAFEGLQTPQEALDQAAAEAALVAAGTGSCSG